MTIKKNILTDNKGLIFDGAIFIIALVVFLATFSLVSNALHTYVTTQKNISATILTSTINDQQIALFNKSNISKDAFSDSLPTQDTILQWIVQTETIASLNHIEQTVNFSNGTLTKNDIVSNQQTASTTPSLPVNIVLKGKYNTILSYIQMLNTSYYYTRIDGITFSAIKGASSSSSTPTVTPTQTANANEYATATLTLDLFVKDISAQISE